MHKYFDNIATIPLESGILRLNYWLQYAVLKPKWFEVFRDSMTAPARENIMIITASDITQLNDQCADLLRRVAKGTVPLSMAREAVQAAIESKILVGAKPVVALSPAGFTHAVEQIVQFRKWNSHHVFGFDEEAIDAMLASVPFVESDDTLVGLTLCWSLDTPSSTVESCLGVMKAVYGEKLYISPDLRTDSDHLSLPEGSPEFVPNRLWWQITDFGANRDKAPDQVPAATAAGLSVFAAACHHPAALQRHNGRDVPYWDVSVLRVSLPFRSRPHAPYIRGGSYGSVDVDVLPAGSTSSRYAEPVDVRE